MLSSDRHYAAAIQDLALTSDGYWMATAANELTGLFDCRTGTPAAPPLLRGTTGLSIHITPDGNRVAVAGFDHSVTGLDLAALTRPAEEDAEDLLRTAEFLACARITDAGAVVRFVEADWQARWTWYRTRQPERLWPTR